MCRTSELLGVADLCRDPGGDDDLTIDDADLRQRAGMSPGEDWDAASSSTSACVWRLNDP